MGVKLKEEIIETLKSLYGFRENQETGRIDRCISRLEDFIDICGEYEYPQFADQLVELISEALDACIYEGFRTGINHMLDLQYRNSAGYLVLMAAKCNSKDVQKLIKMAEKYAEKAAKK